MTFTTDPTISQAVKAFQSLDVDEQLGVFWFIYKEMGGAVTPAAPGASTVSPAIAAQRLQKPHRHAPLRSAHS